MLLFCLVRKLLSKVNICIPCSASLSRDSREVQPVKACSQKFVTAKIAWTPWLWRGRLEIHCIHHSCLAVRGHNRQDRQRHLREEQSRWQAESVWSVAPFKGFKSEHTRTSKAFKSDASSSIFAETSSTPCFSSALAASLEVFRVIPRIFQDLSFSKACTTEPPCTPVAPRTAIVF